MKENNYLVLAQVSIKIGINQMSKVFSIGTGSCYNQGFIKRV